MGEKIDMAMDWIKLKAGKCAASTELEDAKAAVELAKDRVRIAKRAGEFLKLDSRVYSKLIEAEKKLKDLGDGLETIQDICKAVTAIVNIRNAVKILADETIIYRDSEKAARAFGQIFVGFSGLCPYLGPLKIWEPFFKEMGEFFVNLRAKLYPELRQTTKRLAGEMNSNKSYDPQTLRF